MSLLPNQINIAELDFDQILNNLVEFMKTDPTFADYDFSGSGLRLLARVLAYVTFYNGYYLSAAMNESFIDSAQLRSSVVAHARMLGYIAHGVQSARLFANASMQLTATSALAITLPKKTQFQLLANTDISFYTLQDTAFVANSVTGFFDATGMELVEGTPLSYQFTVDLTNPSQRFIIPNANIDYKTVAVRVKASASSNTLTNFQAADNFLTIEPTDPVFFVQESFQGFPELKFGNGVVGLPLEQGNVVLVDYFISRGPAGNGIRGPFKMVNPVLNGFVQGATVVNANSAPSSGGSGPEDIDQVRFLAPNQYQAQNRCVTVEDYKTVILKEYGENIGAINVFGGENGDPNDIKERPIFGRVFIALKPTIGLQFTENTRSFIENQIVKPRSVVGIIPQVIDPDYTFIICNTLVKYDQHVYVGSKLDLQNAITNNILTYSVNNIEKFDASFRFSKLTRIIDDTDDAILSSLTRLDLEKRFFPKLGVPNQFILKFGVALRKIGVKPSF
jgi:hypothetical protein